VPIVYTFGTRFGITGGFVGATGGIGARKRPDDDVTASELGAFTYCAKAWHLARVAGVPVTDGAARSRDGGIIDHARHGRSVRAGTWLGRHGRWAIVGLLVLAVVFGLLAVIAG